MAGKSPLKASAEQKLGVETLAASRDRGEADQARAVLPTLAGRTRRQIAAEIDRVGLRLQLRRAQARAGDIVLLYADESEALTHPYLARAWAKRGADLRVPAPGQAKKVAMMGALDWLQRKLIVATSRTKRSADFIALLVTLDHLYGPKPGVATKPVVIVLDNGPVHVSKATSAALAARAHWLTVEWLPRWPC